jgi:hypothetical protein
MVRLIEKDHVVQISRTIHTVPEAVSEELGGGHAKVVAVVSPVGGCAERAQHTAHVWCP